MPNEHRPSADGFPYTLDVGDDAENREGEFERGSFARLMRKTPTVDDYDRQKVAYIDEREWRTNPIAVLEFIEECIDHYEEHIDDREELPFYVDVQNSGRDVPDGDRPQGAVYIRDPDGGEYLMWTTDEWWMRPNGEDILNSELVQKVLVAVADAYEEPQQFREKWGNRRMQIEVA